MLFRLKVGNVSASHVPREEAKKPGEEHHKPFLDLGEVFPDNHERPAFYALGMLHNLKNKGSDLLRDFTGHHPLPHLTLSCFLLFSL